MMTARSLIIIAAILLFTLSTAAASPIIFVVRHAEKAADGNNPDLSAAGQQRAEGLARILKDAESPRSLPLNSSEHRKRPRLLRKNCTFHRRSYPRTRFPLLSRNCAV